MLGSWLRKRGEASDRKHYGIRQIRNVPHASRPDVICASFENYTLQELVDHLAANKRSSALRELLDRYGAERPFPDLSKFRLGPNMFGQTALDWIVFLSAEKHPQESALIAHGITTRLNWDGNPDTLPRGWTGAVRASYEQTTIGAERPNTLIGLFIFAENAFREHGWAVEVAEQMKRLAAESQLQHLIIPLRLPTRYEWQNARLPYEEFAFLKRDDGQYNDHWLRLHVRLGAEVIATCDVSHQHALHPDDLVRQFQCGAIDRTGEHLVRLNDEYYNAFIDLERGYAVINEGCVWVRYVIGTAG